MSYTKSIPFNGSPSDALETARLQFAVHGFQVDQPVPNQLVAVGPGMQSTNQNPILGVSRVTITINPDTIDLQAELAAVRFMQRFIFFLPPALCAFVALILAFIPSLPTYTPILAFTPVLPWLITYPLIARRVKYNTTHALDTLLHNLAHANEYAQ
ncbi:MAG: hypothetical protein JW936_03315 [Sedimentisphaerales bacterium]|nr:hypothetical protein [Sedimentisphaerales bacterium]